MSNPVLFYSWQSDLPRSATRDFIHIAAEAAVAKVAYRVSLEDSPRLDHDTLDEAGAPAITETIFRKIRESAFFLADVTFVAETVVKDGKKGKRIPNPNVLLELGYAAATIGWERILLVMNKHFGSPESLPFDLRYRRFPITFDLAPNSRKDISADELATDIESALLLGLSQEYGRVEETLARLSSYARKIMFDHGTSAAFHELEADNKILTRQDLAISQLLQSGVVKCIPAPSATSGVAYQWTYLGRQCCSRLGIVQLTQTANNAPLAPTVEAIVAMPFIDALGDGKQD